MGELKDLEQMKGALGQTTKEDHFPQIENFIFSNFAKIDKEERVAEKLTKGHALEFKQCGDFIQILSMFGPIEKDWAERDKYCKFKVVGILKCIKSGEEP